MRAVDHPRLTLHSSHGRDNTLRIWQLRHTHLLCLSTVPPADGSGTHRPKPWLLHSLPVNTLNFCAFSMCYDGTQGSKTESEKGHAFSAVSSDSILVAVPARDDRKIEVYRLPDEKLAYIVPRVETADTGKNAPLSGRLSGCISSDTKVCSPLLNIHYTPPGMAHHVSTTIGTFR